MTVVRTVGYIGSSGGLAKALRCVFEHISSGCLLPGGMGIHDPSKDAIDFSQITDEKERIAAYQALDIASCLTDEQRDIITKDAQDILRDIAHGRWEAFLGDSAPS